MSATDEIKKNANAFVVVDQDIRLFGAGFMKITHDGTDFQFERIDPKGIKILENNVVQIPCTDIDKTT